MRNTKLKIVLLCSAIVVLSGIVGFNANSKINYMEKEIAILNEKIESTRSDLEDFKEKNEELQELLNNANYEIENVKKEIKEITE